MPKSDRVTKQHVAGEIDGMRYEYELIARRRYAVATVAITTRCGQRRTKARIGLRPYETREEAEQAVRLFARRVGAAA
jgi:hypothetical protein